MMATSQEAMQRNLERLERAKAWVQKTTAAPDDEILDHLAAVRREFLARLDGVSEAQANFSPGPGQWSISEVIRHMAHSNSGVAGLVRALAAGAGLEGEPKMGIVPDSAGSFEADRATLEKSLDDLQQSFEPLRARPNLDATYKHPWFGHLNARQWFVFSIVHLRAHVDQLDRIKRAEDFPAS